MTGRSAMLALAVAASSLVPAEPAAADDAALEKVRHQMARLNFVDSFSSNSCTATLFTERSALTAERCISGAPVAALHLLFGYDRGEWTAHRRVEASFEDPSRNGLVLLCLDGRVTGEVHTSGAHLAVGEEVLIASYRAPRAHVLSADRCRVVEAAEAIGLLGHCGVSAGAAGGGVFRLVEGQAHLTGVVTVHTENEVVLRAWTGQDPEGLCRGI